MRPSLRTGVTGVTMVVGAAALAACTSTVPKDPQTQREQAFATLTEIEAEAAATRAATAPEYLGIDTRLLDGDLVSFVVQMRQAPDEAAVTRYSECAAAQYALIRGYGFARHVRTTVDTESSVWKADAVYTISPALPDGVNTLDAEVTVANCRENGIPTV